MLNKTQQGDYDALDTLAAFDGTDMEREYRAEVARATGGPDYRATSVPIARKRMRSLATRAPVVSSPCRDDIRSARTGEESPRVTRAFASYTEVRLPHHEEEPRPLGFLERLTYFSRVIF